jgi:RecB family endonuclease NucS
MQDSTCDGVEQLTRHLDLLDGDPLLAPVRGVLAAQDDSALRGADDPSSRLF